MVQIDSPDLETTAVIDVNTFRDCALKVEPETHKLILHPQWSKCSAQADDVVGKDAAAKKNYVRLGQCTAFAENRAQGSDEAGEDYIGADPSDPGAEKGKTFLTLPSKTTQNTADYKSGSANPGSVHQSSTDTMVAVDEFTVTLDNCADLCKKLENEDDMGKSCGAFAFHKTGWKTGDMLEEDGSDNLCCTLFRKDACDVMQGGSSMVLPTGQDQLLYEMGLGFPAGMNLEAVYYQPGKKELQDLPWQFLYEGVRTTLIGITNPGSEATRFPFSEL
ncbi:unnamed protein product, partial [Amoebophrya sp. A120]|eukprot:GSA120T00015482001.1